MSKKKINVMMYTEEMMNMVNAHIAPSVDILEAVIHNMHAAISMVDRAVNDGRRSKGEEPLDIVGALQPQITSLRLSAASIRSSLP
jgi:hypothetical protein